nr:hypothetical protein [Tanacetum cinerariifolium]
MWWRLAVVVCRGDEGGGESDGDNGNDDDVDGVPVVEAAMEVVMVVVMIAMMAAMVVWQHGDDVVVRWWREAVGISGGCGLACRLGWPEFWPDGGAASKNL